MDVDVPPDPIIKLLHSCVGRSGRSCGKPMQPITVYRGLGVTSKRHLRGSLSQTCSDFQCLSTFHHTPAYNFEDAERFLRRLINPGDPTGYPRTLRPSDNNAIAPPVQPPASQPPLPMQPVPTTQSTKIYCAAPNCYTMSRNRTQGSRSCIENKCKKCCVLAAGNAMRSGDARKACHTHSQSEIMARRVLNLFPVPEPQPIPGTQDLTAAGEAQGPGLTPPPQSETPAPVPLPQTTHPIPAASSQVPSQHVEPRGLAQPVGGTWANKRSNAISEAQSIKTLKVQQHEMYEQQKRTCVLVVYHTNGEPPIRLVYYVQSFPHLRLSASDQLIKDLELQTTTKLDFWKGEWITVSLDTVLTVEKGQRVLLKIRPSLRKTLNDCPGIEEELEMQPKYHSAGIKRRAEELVSPLAHKVQRNDTAKSAHISAHKPPPIFANSESDPEVISSKPPTRRWHIPKQHPKQKYIQPNSDSESLTPVPKKPALSSISKSHTEQTSKSNESVRWPHKFKVYQIHNGFIQIRDTLKKAAICGTGRSSHSEKSRPKYAITVEQAFRAAFPKATYRSSTFYDHRDYWATYDRQIVDLFIDRGDSEDATYEDLLKALKNPIHIPSPTISESDNSSSSDENSPEDEIEQPVHGPITSSSNQSVPDPRPRDFNNLCSRIQEMKETLEEIVLEPEESQFFCTSRDTYKASSSQRSKSNSQALLDCISYYGTARHALITSELMAIFPENSLDLQLLTPLSRKAVIEEFLFPETVILLLQDELRISTPEILQMLREKNVGDMGFGSKPIKLEVEDISLPVNQDVHQSRIVIDLTASSPPPVIKEEPIDNSSMVGDIGKACVNFDSDIIDLTMDSDDDTRNY